MFESGYYPAGAECDPSAPYNEPADNEPVGVEVDVYVQLSKNDKVYTCDYVFDEDGYDFSDACFRQDWQDLAGFTRFT